MKSRYDLIFSMGAACACSQALRHAGLQHLSMPFDWMGGGHLRERTDLLEIDFAGWLERDTFERVTKPRYGRETYWRDTWHVAPIHDLNTSQPLEEQLPAVQRKYARRVGRLHQLIRQSQRVLVVYLCDALFTSPTPDDLRHLHEVLSRKWPSVTFDVLMLTDDENVKLPACDERVDGSCRIVSFANCKPNGAGLPSVDHELVGAWLAEHFEVTDYRTAEERRSASRKRRQAHYAKFAATNYLGFVWNRMQYKLYRHLQRKLARRGIA